MCRGLRERTMTGQLPEIYDRVGPVLQSGPVANAIIAAIKDLNHDVLVEVLDRRNDCVSDRARLENGANAIIDLWELAGHC